MKKWLKRIGLVLAALIVITGYALLLWKGPWYFDGDHLRKKHLQPADGVVITGFRTMVVAFGAGLLAAFGVYYTHRNHVLAQSQFKHTEKQFQLAQAQFKLAQDQFEQSQVQFTYEQTKDREAAQAAREAQATEQYVTAIKLLASSSATERLGAIYSLQRIMRDSSRDADAIEIILATFIRERKEVAADQFRFDPKGVAPEYGSDYHAAKKVLREWRGTE